MKEQFTLVGINLLPEIIFGRFFIGNKFTNSNASIKCVYDPPFGWYQLIPQFNGQKLAKNLELSQRFIF
jgi:hypothetical protein